MPTTGPSREVEPQVLAVEPPVLAVAIGVIRDAAGRYLLARRRPGQEHGDCWEFPGGKCEPGETGAAALARELGEELGIHPTQARPLIRVRHRYPQRMVCLDCWLVEAYRGKIHGREGQAIRWVAPRDLGDYPLPAANRAILAALALPERYLITPPTIDSAAAFLADLESRLAMGMTLVQLRLLGLSAPRLWYHLAQQAAQLAKRHRARLLIHADPGLAQEVGAAGVHLPERQLMALTTRPLPRPYLVGVSCHTEQALVQAARIDADFAVLSPVKATASHPEAKPLGWAGFGTLADTATYPVYALGGLSEADLPEAFAHGAQGIAAIRGLWDRRSKMRG